jgi:hypothetical protein
MSDRRHVNHHLRAMVTKYIFGGSFTDIRVKNLNARWRIDPRSPIDAEDLMT